MRSHVAWLSAILSVALYGEQAQAQNAASMRYGVFASHARDSLRAPAAQRGPSLLVATLASSVIPGAGQTLLGSRRAFAYAAAEVAGLVAYSLQHGDGARQRDRYRELSRSIARLPFDPAGPTGDWDYYERMEKFAASGAFDRIPGGTIEPETDETTYNGSMWLLARQTYWRDPTQPPPLASSEYAAALAFYQKRAVPDEMRWSWLGSPEGLQQYKRAIARSNSSFKRAEQTAGLVIANHMLSAVDAFVSVKLRARTTPNGRIALTAGIPIGSTH